MSIRPGDGKTDFYIVAYDIPDDKRRTKVHKILSGFGGWTQFSLFECWLSPKELVILRQKLDKHLSAAKDRVRFYYLCDGCLKKVETIGMELPHDNTLYLV